MGTSTGSGLLKKSAMLTAIFAMMLGVLMVAPQTSDAQPGSGLIFATDAKCIASDTVQGDPAAASMGVGNVYEGSDGSRHLITTGGPSCKFNCAMGFDINCDGVRGDYCPPGLNLSRVSDVGKCIASFANQDGAAAAAAAGTGGGIADVGALAHTGNESNALAFMGAGLLSAGATLLGLRRRVRD